MKRTIVILSLLFCSCNSIEGVVDRKEFVPQHNETIATVETRIGIGWDNKVHTSIVPITKEITVPDQFFIIVGTTNNQYKLTVDKSEYQSYTIGDHYPHYERP